MNKQQPIKLVLKNFKKNLMVIIFISKITLKTIISKYLSDRSWKFIFR
jgi:hypothetical protein